MDLLSGVGGGCASTERVESVTRRDSSISLEDGAYKRHTPEPVKSPLSSFDLRIFGEPQGTGHGDGCTLPTPSLASSPSVVAPMDVYLRCDESHESRMMRLGSTISDQDNSTSGLENISTCSWEFIDVPSHSQEMPNTPVLSPKSSAKPSHPRGKKIIPSDSDMSELALSVDSQPLSEDTQTYKEVVAGYKAASKRYKHVGAKTSKRPRIYKSARGIKRKGQERKMGGGREEERG